MLIFSFNSVSFFIWSNISVIWSDFLLFNCSVRGPLILSLCLKNLILIGNYFKFSERSFLLPLGFNRYSILFSEDTFFNTINKDLIRMIKCSICFP